MTDRLDGITQHCCICSMCDEDHGGRCAPVHPTPTAFPLTVGDGVAPLTVGEGVTPLTVDAARLDAEAATAQGCSRCGFMSSVGHDCPELRGSTNPSPISSSSTPPPPLPDEVEAALYPTITKLREQVAALTAERDALAERVRGMEDHDCDRWRSEGLGCRLCNPVADEPEERDRQTRIEALEWVLTLEDDPRAMNKIEAEIARLRAEQGEGA